MEDKLRKTGLDVIGDVPWGTHFCQFYQTKADLIDILVPYFKEGLENNEFCMWITSKPLHIRDAKSLLRKAVKNLDAYIKKGQIEILDYKSWYIKSGKFSAARVLNGWVSKEKWARKRGFGGLRLTGNTFWLEKKDWQAFTDYERTVDDTIGNYRMLAICTYPLQKCGASEIIDVVSNHEFALIKRNNNWELIEGSERRRREEKIIHLASFPRLNPHPIMELDAEGRVTFSNDALQRCMTELRIEDISFFFPHDLNDILKILQEETFETPTFYREVNIKNKTFGEHIILIKELKVLRIYADDITEQKRAEHEREITIDFLRLLNESAGSRGMIREATAFFQKLSGCEAVGIRLKEEDDYPFAEARGFPPEFLLTENSLCTRNGIGKVVRDDSGKPMYECLCGSVIYGLFDVSKPFFTERGSFWVNSTTEWFAATTAAERPPITRNRCNAEGYESVALISLRIGLEQFGVLQLNDRRKGLFSSDAIEFWERLAGHLSVILTKVLAEEALHASMERYQSCIEITGQLGWTTNGEGELVDDIPSWREYTGQTYNEIRGWGWSKALHPDDLEHTIREWKKALADKSTYEVEYRICRHDGVYRHFLARGIPLFKKDGNVREWVGTCIDITERKQIEEALKSSENRYRRLFETAQDGILILNAETGQISDVNPFLIKMLGYSHEDLLGKKLWEIGAFKDIEASKAAFLELQGKGYVRYSDLPLETKDGRSMDVEFVSNVYLVNHHKVIQCNIRDITERKQIADALHRAHNELERRVEERTEEVRKLNEQLEQRVAERTAQLEASNRELESFSYSISHDLRTPLRAIDGFSRKILEAYQDTLDKEGKRLLNIIRKNIKDMGQLIDDLLAFSRVGRQKIHLSDIDMNGLAKMVYRDLTALVPGRTIDFVMKTCPLARADKSLIRQILANLLSNAIKFTEPCGDALIEFGGRSEDRQNVYYVKDNGVGFDMRYADKLYGVFQRLHSADEFEGTGVGLAIVQRIVLMHGGSVWAEGKENEGSTFYFALPK